MSDGAELKEKKTCAAVRLAHFYKKKKKNKSRSIPVIKNNKDHCAAVCCKMNNFTDADLA